MLSTNQKNIATENYSPLNHLDEWEEDILNRYPDPSEIATNKATEAFRNYEEPTRDTVKEFYRLNHQYQSYDYVLEKKANYLQFNKKEMPIWNAFDFLNELVDDSDPDTSLDQMQHLLQTSEAIRMFLQQTINDQALPFQPRINKSPNNNTIKSTKGGWVQDLSTRG
jgi:inositol oxygenase